MIAACPQCQTRFRLAREKLGPQGARIRCSQCQTVFRVQAPDAAGPLTPAEARPSPVVAPPPPAPPAPPKPQPPLAHALIAEPDPELAKGVAELCARWRISSEIVGDGADALLAIFRSPPRIALLGAGLSSLSAEKLCEIVRRAGLPEAPKLVQVAVASEPSAPGYAADAILEPADLPAGLAAVLERLGIGARPLEAPAKPAPAPAPVAAPQPAPVVAPAAPAAPAPAKPSRPVPSSDPEIAAAERLARIAVSDVILYNEQKFAAAAQAGNAAKALAAELEEARQHFNSRVSPIVRQSRDFLREELERRAAQRRG